MPRRSELDGIVTDKTRPPLSFGKRKDIINNLCDYFDTIVEPVIFVVDEADENRKELEQLFSGLVSKGHKITVEYDSAKKREQTRKNEYIGILKAGKKLSINGWEIDSLEALEDYWRANKKHEKVIRHQGLKAKE